MNSKFSQEWPKPKHSTKLAPSINLIIPDVELRLHEANPFANESLHSENKQFTQRKSKEAKISRKRSQKKSVKIRQPVEDDSKSSGVVTGVFEKIKKSSFKYHDKRVIDKYNEPEVLTAKKSKSKSSLKNTCRVS
jgi:hypothetical protein